MERTPEQTANLLKLASYLEGLPPGYGRFSMLDYASVRVPGTFPGRLTPAQVVQMAKTACGTVACAAGHGPDAGIAPLPEEMWDAYTERSFGVSLQSDAWEWCFSAGWTWTDNTPAGAAARIRWMLENGVPEDWQDQQDGEAALCYREEAA